MSARKWLYLNIDEVLSVLDGVEASVEDRMFSGCAGRPLCHGTKDLQTHTNVH
jgi:hypothetical protein